MLQRAVLNTRNRVVTAASATPMLTSHSQLFSDLSQSSVDVINRLAEEKQSSVSLSQLYDFGLQASDDAAAAETVLIQAAQYLHMELPKRMAHRIVELQHLPDGMASMPSIRRVAEWYMDSVHELIAHPIPVDVETEKSMTRLIEGIYSRHSKTLVTMARGVAEFKRAMGYQPTDMLPDHLEDPLTQFLNGFYGSRIGIRTLIEQHVALHHPRPGHVGIINCHTHPVAICRDAADEAAIMCERELGASPLVEIIGDSDFSFNFIDSHMHHVMFEILKNAFRAVVERHGEDADLPPVTVVVATDSSAEDIAIKVSDQGGGIPRSAMKRVWSYFYTSSNSGALDVLEDGADFSTNTPLAGLGYGLPLSRVYARYFGGDLSIVPMQNYGTDAFVFLKRVGDAMEPAPPIVDLSNAVPR